MIVIVDYGMGNLGSVSKSLKKANSQIKISNKHNDIEMSDKIILPGVGNFKKAMKNLESLNLIELLNHKVLEMKTPILGICLGMQLFSEFSEEGNVRGLSWINSSVVKFNVSDKIRFKVPHMGWNSVKIKKNSPLLMDLAGDNLFYFVHSYHLVCNNEKDILATTNYSYEFVSAVQKDNIFGTQFHPEKSHLDGQMIINNFVNQI